MITRDQFEAHVRAEAERKHPDDPQGKYPEHGSSYVSYESEREAYIAARMEHEWPLVEALVLAHDLAENELVDYAKYGLSSHDDIERRYRAALSHYTTKAVK